jgi:hypothetical protein
MVHGIDCEVPPLDREVLALWVRSPSIRAGLARRARIVLLAADGIGTNEIVRRTGASKRGGGRSSFDPGRATRRPGHLRRR